MGERIDPATKAVSFLALAYDPAADAWRTKELPRTPANGSWQYAEVVAGKVVYGGSGPTVKDAAGAGHGTTELALFDPRAMTLTALPLIPNRVAAAPVVANGKVLVWGGQDTFNELGTPPPCATPTMPACDPITPMRTALRGDGLLLVPN